ncbi:unnamed protein product, partial [Vitis vinifera]
MFHHPLLDPPLKTKKKKNPWLEG